MPDTTFTLDDIIDALMLATNLGATEAGMQAHKVQIDAFMQDVDADMSDEAQAAFEDWALIRQNLNRAFRRIGIKHQEGWCAKDYMLAGTNLLKQLTPLV